MAEGPPARRLMVRENMRFLRRMIVPAPGRLRQWIEWNLVAHLTTAGLVFALIAGVITYTVRRGEIAEEVLFRASTNLELLTALARQVSQNEGIGLVEAAKSVLSNMKQSLFDDENGRFLAVRITDLGGKILLERSNVSSYDDIKATPLIESEQLPYKHEVFRYAIQTLGKSMFIVIEGPLLDQKGTYVATGRGLFVISDKKRLELGRQTLTGAALIAIIVLVTTAGLYPVIFILFHRLKRLTKKLLLSNLEMLQVIGSAVAKRDRDTDEHNYRVSLYSASIGRALGIPLSELRRLLKGAFLHDVGKIGIEDRILRKPGPLNPNERDRMRQHVSIGLDIIRRSQWLVDASDVVGGHHERFEGGGYPRGLVGAEIPLAARIFAVADVFDALCSERPYKKALPPDMALSIMREEVGHFDPAIFAVFEKIATAIHARYASCTNEELRVELAAILIRAFSEELSQLERKS